LYQAFEHGWVAVEGSQLLLVDEIYRISAGGKGDF
jgi:hypothetical protein